MYILGNLIRLIPVIGIQVIPQRSIILIVHGSQLDSDTFLLDVGFVRDSKP
jgi:hypothetical protein